MRSDVIWRRGVQKCVTTKFTLISCVTVSSYMTPESGPYQTNKILPRRRSGAVLPRHKHFKRLNLGVYTWSPLRRRGKILLVWYGPDSSVM